MINYIWAFLILVSITVACFTGKIDQTILSAFSGANSAISTVLGFIGVMAMWTGLINIAEKSGLIKIFAKIIAPVNRLIFPEIKKDSPAFNAITMNMVANILGLANAATPLGIKAMQELKKLSTEKESATKSMCMFVVINTASIQLIPSTLIGLRATFGSANPSEIVLPVWIVSIIAASCAIFSAKICAKRESLSSKKYERIMQR